MRKIIMGIFIASLVLIVGCGDEYDAEGSRGLSPGTKAKRKDKKTDVDQRFTRKFESIPITVDSLEAGQDSNYYLITKVGQLAVSSNASNWRTLSLPNHAEFTAPSTVRVDSQGVIYLVDTAGGLFVSEDEGESYRQIGLGGAFLEVEKIEVSEDDQVFAANLSEFYVLTNQGRNVVKKN